MNEKDHSAYRAIHIITRLYGGAKISLNELAQEFNVSIRTLQRDIARIGEIIPLNRDKDGVAMDIFAINEDSNPTNITLEYIKKFARLSGIESLYPSLEQDFLVDLFDENHHISVAKEAYEKPKKAAFEELSLAIDNKEILSFSYNAKMRKVKPYSLKSIKGIWYLIAEESGTLKHFTLSKISHLRTTQEIFTPNKTLLNSLKDNNKTWLTKSPKSATIAISNARAKAYFLRRELPTHIKIISNNEGSSLRAKIEFAFDDELFNLVKLWLPYMQIIEPPTLKEAFSKILRDYLDSEDS